MSTRAAARYTPTSRSEGSGSTPLATISCASPSTGKNPPSTGFQIAADRFLLISDPNPPAITVPSNMTVEATGPAGAPASPTTGSATDKQEGTLPVTFSPASGSTFPLGMHDRDRHRHAT